MRIYERRRLIERIEARRNAHLSGVFANPNYDKQKEGEAEARRQLVEEIEEAYNEEIRRVMIGSSRKHEEEEADRQIASDPFFREPIIR